MKEPRDHARALLKKAANDLINDTNLKPFTVLGHSCAHTTLQQDVIVFADPRGLPFS